MPPERTLAIPIDDQKAFEILRVWVNDDKQYVSLRAGAFSDPAMWGLLLVDLAKHAANSYGRSGHMTTEKALARVWEGFDAERDAPTDDPTGNLE